MSKQLFDQIVAEHTNDYSTMTVTQLAREIRRNWSKVNYAAEPYLQAMSGLDSVDDNYGMDSGKSIVRYFLGNATSWRGEVAREIKKELNKRVK